MITHYLKTALRNLLKFRAQSIFSIVSVSIGLVSFLFGYQWLTYETSFDSFYPKSKHIYKVVGVELQTGKMVDKNSYALMQTLQTDFPEIEAVIPIYSRYGSTLKEGDRVLADPLLEEFVDERFLQYFTPQVICGKPAEDLMQQETDLVITRSYAVKHWGSPEEAIGKTIQGGYKRTLEVVAVIENYPENSNFKDLEALMVDIQTRRWANRIEEQRRWTQSQVWIYICLHENVNVEAFGEKISTYLIDNKLNENLKLELIPLTEVRHAFAADGSFNINYIRTFAATTFILLICVFLNFLNLWMNRVNQRIKEMRLRHAIGAKKHTLIGQLLTEVVLQFLFILLLSCCMIEVLLPLLSTFFNITMLPDGLWRNFFIAYLIGLITMLLLCYPLLLIFIRRSALTLSGGVQAHHASMTRKVAMTFQVGICVAFIFSALSIGHQVQYMMNKELGFKKEGLLFFRMSNGDREATVRQIETIPQIERFAAAGIFLISHEPRTTNIIDWEGKPEDYKPNFQMLDVDSAFLATMKINLLAGDATDALINEEAARVIGGDNLIGSKIRHWDYSTNRSGEYGMREVTISGIVKNFQSASFRHPVIPVLLLPDNRQRYRGYAYYARVSPDKEEEGKQLIFDAFRQVAASSDPEPKISSVTEVLSSLHKSEEGSLRLFIMLASLSVIISLFGIYSISHSTMRRRRKEIAVRKVMGGSTKNIIRMFAFEYLQITVIANAIFIPIAWLFVHSWMQQFPMRATVGWLEVVTVLIVTTLFVMATVLGHIIKASKENPADVVKSE
ncbi:ABC transporter permease [Bacteroides sp. 214]|uniref:ABC transporter permease n=1 Tax=Bacteroides sp. 214 TaxID=2302935 RepID=UPI0013D6F969|nr:ABC transporter permease [Bacteroides sp. 214]NDW13579.1 ABC transporter permease [Bacteroides sp. 214]